MEQFTDNLCNHPDHEAGHGATPNHPPFSMNAIMLHQGDCSRCPITRMRASDWIAYRAPTRRRASRTPETRTCLSPRSAHQRHSKSISKWSTPIWLRSRQTSASSRSTHGKRMDKGKLALAWLADENGVPRSAESRVHSAAMTNP